MTCFVFASDHLALTGTPPSKGGDGMCSYLKTHPPLR